MWQSVFVALCASVAAAVVLGLLHAAAEVRNELTIQLPMRLYEHDRLQYDVMRCPADYRARVAWLDECDVVGRAPDVRTDVVPEWVLRWDAWRTRAEAAVVVLIFCLVVRANHLRRRALAVTLPRSLLRRGE